jgi:hypothetical protein
MSVEKHVYAKCAGCQVFHWSYEPCKAREGAQVRMSEVTRAKHFIGVIDPPCILRDGEKLTDADFVLQSVGYGRVLFTTVAACEVRGKGTVISNCHFVMGAGSYGVCLAETV